MRKEPSVWRCSGTGTGTGNRGPAGSGAGNRGRGRGQGQRPPPSHELPGRGAGGVGGGPAGGGGGAGRAAHRAAAPQHRQVPLQEGGHLLHRHRRHPGRRLRLHRLRLRPRLLRGARPGSPQGCRGVQGRAAQLGQRRDGADLAGVLPEEEIPLALLGRVHPLGAVDHQGERGEPGQRAGEADLPREGGREALREDHQHRGGDEPPRVPAQDAHPVRGGQRLRHQPEGRAALPLQDLLPDHGLPGHLGHHHHAAAHQRHAGSVGPAFGAAFSPPRPTHTNTPQSAASGSGERRLPPLRLLKSFCEELGSAQPLIGGCCWFWGERVVGCWPPKLARPGEPAGWLLLSTAPPRRWDPPGVEK